MHAVAAISIQGRVGNFNKKVLFLETRRDVGAEPQSLVSAPNIHWSNPRSLHSAEDVKAYVGLLLLVIRPFYRDIKTRGPLVVFEKSRLMPATSYHLILLHLTHYNKIQYSLIYTHPTHLLEFTIRPHPSI